MNDENLNVEALARLSERVAAFRRQRFQPSAASAANRISFSRASSPKPPPLLKWTSTPANAKSTQKAKGLCDYELNCYAATVAAFNCDLLQIWLGRRRKRLPGQLARCLIGLGTN
jgi:hypothetical protein